MITWSFCSEIICKIREASKVAKRCAKEKSGLRSKCYLGARGSETDNFVLREIQIKIKIGKTGECMGTNKNLYNIENKSQSFWIPVDGAASESGWSLDFFMS